MTTYTCATDKDPGKREEPAKLSSVHMSGNWAHHAYKRSYDGKHTVVFNEAGFTVIKGSNKPVTYEYTFHGQTRAFYWHPDNKKIAYFGTGEKDNGAETNNRCVVVLNMSQVTEDGGGGGRPPHEVVYSPPPEYGPFGLEWSPKGDAIYVVETFREEFNLYSRIVRVDVATKQVKQIVRIGGKIDFFMPPVSRFENGDGSSSSKYFIVYGHPTGLFLTDPQGKKIRRVSKLPAIGLHNIEWNPAKGKNQLVLYFRKSATSPTGEKFKGVYMIHLARINREKEKGPAVEQLYDRTDVHTLWYSPRGKYVCWATADAIFYRRPLDKPDKTVKLIALHDELELEIKGMAWRGDGNVLAFTAGNHLFSHDVIQPDAPPTRLATFGKDTTHFTAEPIWVGNDVFLTVFEDMTHRVKKQRTGGGTQITVKKKR